MPTPDSPDHDQRLKVLLKEFFEQFSLCFFPPWAPRFDFGGVTWMDKEVFLAPPQGIQMMIHALCFGLPVAVMFALSQTHTIRVDDQLRPR